MIFNLLETNDSYIFPVGKEYFDYLKERHIVSKDYICSLKSKQVGILNENVIMIDNRPFCLQCILGSSDDNIFDIIKTNELYKIKADEGTAFGVLYGDDYLLFKPNDERIYYQSLSGDETIAIADTYKDFIAMIKTENANTDEEMKQLKEPNCEADWRCYNIKHEE